MLLKSQTGNSYVWSYLDTIVHLWRGLSHVKAYHMAPTSRSRDPEPYFLLVHTGIAPLTLMKLQFTLAEDLALSFESFCCFSVLHDLSFYDHMTTLFSLVLGNVVVNPDLSLLCKCWGFSSLLSHNKNISWWKLLTFCIGWDLREVTFKQRGEQELEK